MKHPHSQLEERLYRTLVDDGLPDLLLGGLIFTFGVTMATEFDFLPAAFGAIAFSLWRKLRASLVEPRVGYVQPHPLRQELIQRGRSVAWTALAVAVVGLVAILVIEGSWQVQAIGMRSVLAAVVLALPIAVSAYWFAMPRLQAHAAALVGLALLESLAGAPFGTGMLASGALLIAIGLLRLGRFLRDHPPPSAGQPLDPTLADSSEVR